ncbi:unnamed protein product, partial [Discosporangium mesarthrocarpum]
AEPIRNDARVALRAAVFRLRRSHGRALARVTAATNAQEEGLGVGSVALGGPGAGAGALASSMPEYVLPYVVHLLAHHPNFPIDKDDKPRLKNLQRHLCFVLEPLIDSS